MTILNKFPMPEIPVLIFEFLWTYSQFDRIIYYKIGAVARSMALIRMRTELSLFQPIQRL